MSRGARRLTAALAGVVALLFAGRWTAILLTDRWWAAQLSPAAAVFLTNWHLLRLVLEITGVLVASAWFIGHLLLVYRAVGSVQVRRNVANLEFREALTPRALLTVAVAVGALLGLLVGSGASGWWRQVALGWQGVTYGVTEPLMERDIGLYVAQLPLWRAAHSGFLLIVLLALGVVFGLYLLVGAVRWMDGRPAISDHARSHLGWLLAGLGLALMWGYLLEPYELVAGLSGLPDRAAWQSTTLVAPLLAGVALATAGLSAAWAVRPRHALVAAGWIVLALASLIGHWMVPPALGGEGEAAGPRSVRDQLDRMAYGLAPLTEQQLPSSGHLAAPPVPSLWNPAIIARVLSADSGQVLSADPAAITLQGRPRPTWLASRTLPDGRLGIVAIADDRAGPAGEPLFYQAGDSAPRPTAVPLIELSPGAIRPDAGDYHVGSGAVHGVDADSWGRRLLLAWVRQAGDLLGPVPPDTKVDWRLAPEVRLGALAPYATWKAPMLRIVEGEPMWLAEGYLASDGWPLSGRVVWGNHRIGALRAAFLGTVEAETGVSHVYLRPNPDPLAEAWTVLSHGVVEPTSAIPEAVLRAAPYPADLLRVQARELEHPGWNVGTVGGRSGPDPVELPRTELAWAADSSGPLLTIAYERPGERRLSAVLVAGREEGADVLRLVRFDSASALPSRSVLESRWGRFPSYDALNDSIRDDGGRMERGPVRYDLSSGGVVAYQAQFARRPAGSMALVWVSVAADERLGAGRTLKEAWSNLLGASVPALAGSAQATRLEEARDWLMRADSALRAADWPGFGRAWNGLRRSLGLPADSTTQ